MRSVLWVEPRNAQPRHPTMGCLCVPIPKRAKAADTLLPIPPMPPEERAAHSEHHEPHDNRSSDRGHWHRAWPTVDCHRARTHYID